MERRGWLRTRTMPAEFFQRAMATMSPPSVSGRDDASISSLCSSLPSQQLWDVVAFLDMRSVTEDGLALGMLPIPQTRNVARHLLEQLQLCRRLWIIASPESYPALKALGNASVHPGIKVLLAERDMDPWLIVEHYHRAWGHEWEPGTVTLWWEPNVLLEHQILWRPATDAHPLVVFQGEQEPHRRIAVAWRHDQWLKLTSLRPEELPSPRVIPVSQRVWQITQEMEYFTFIYERMRALGVMSNC